jgi:hypothetical protein
MFGVTDKIVNLNVYDRPLTNSGIQLLNTSLQVPLSSAKTNRIGIHTQEWFLLILLFDVLIIFFVMKKDTIFQFVGFETPGKSEDFTEQWKNFASRFFKQDVHHISLQQQVLPGNRFNYISKNEWPQDNFRFVFMEGRLSDYFPDHRSKVVQAGGYLPLQMECYDNPGEDEICILAFVRDEGANLSICNKLPYHYLNIYQAYYQNCLYAYILEFYVKEENSRNLISQLKKRFDHVETGMYKECMVLDG